jgi:hypothetical protein
MDLTFICVQPCTQYYAWQIEVMLTNFRDCGIAKDFSVNCLFAYNKNESDWKEKVATIKKVEERMTGVAEFFYYEDTRKYPISYISSIRPNILKQHFKIFPKLSERAIFYHDCDIVFTKYPDFLNEELLQNDMTWYVSDTKSYISYSYIISKGEDVLNKMCDIVGINPSLVKYKEEESGGAQYLLKGIDWRFFEKMESDCEVLFKDINILNAEKKKSDPNHHELQIWCADMWAILWSGWMRGYTTEIIPELNFCWATDRAERWHEVYIFHNAGVTSESAHRLFFKGAFTSNLPFLETGETYDRGTASYKYFSIIKSIGNNSCLIESQTQQVFDPMFLKMGVIKRAHSRYLVCKSCENFVVSATEKEICKLCGCQTEKKIISDDPNDCPENKWTS